MGRKRGRPRKNQDEKQATGSKRSRLRKNTEDFEGENPQTPSFTPSTGFSSASGGPANKTPGNHSSYSKFLLTLCNTSGTSPRDPIRNVNGDPSQYSAWTPSGSFLKTNSDDTFNKGMLVEVSSDEDGFQGSWFAASVMEKLSNGNFLIEHKCLRNDDDTEFLREEIDSHHIRPYPPNIQVNDCFHPLEEVDTLYNDGWWKGTISKVLDGQKYMVYFQDFNQEWEFKHSDLRPHVEWIDGIWVSASRVINSQAGADETVGNSEASNLKILSLTSTHDMPVSDNFVSTSPAVIALSSSAHGIVENSTEGSGVDCKEKDMTHSSEISTSNALIALPSSADMVMENSTEGSGINHKEKDTSNLSETSSFNYTDIAQLLEDGSFDEDEVATDPALVTVNGYTVKEEFASLLRSVLLKYGDIAKECSLKSIAGRSSQLERLCAIYQNLEKRVYNDITTSDIDSMLAEVEDLEVINLEVDWLRKRLQDISDALIKSKAYPAMKKRKVEIRDVETAKEKLLLAKREHSAKLAEGERMDETLLVIKAKMRMFQHSLVYGLI